MMLLQAIMAFLIFMAWLSAVIKLRDKRITIREFIFWTIVWGALGIFSSFPIIPSKISELLGVGRGVDLVIYATLFVLLFLNFKMYTRMEDQDKRITKLVREYAIDKAKKK